AFERSSGIVAPRQGRWRWCRWAVRGGGQRLPGEDGMPARLHARAIAGPPVGLLLRGERGQRGIERGQGHGTGWRRGWLDACERLRDWRLPGGGTADHAGDEKESHGEVRQQDRDI